MALTQSEHFIIHYFSQTQLKHGTEKGISEKKENIWTNTGKM